MMKQGNDSGDRPALGESELRRALIAGAEALSLCGYERVSVADYAYSVEAMVSALPDEYARLLSGLALGSIPNHGVEVVGKS